MARTLRLFLLLFLFSMAFVFISFKSPYAASNGIQTLVDKLDRLEKDLNGLQKYVFKGEKNKKDNLELKGLPKEMSKSLTARYEVKINDLSDQIRRIRGSIEELEFRFIQVNERLDALNNYLTSSPSSSGNQLLRDPTLQGALNDTLSTSEEL